MSAAEEEEGPLVSFEFVPDGQVKILQVPVGLGGHICIDVGFEDGQMTFSVISDAKDLNLLRATFQLLAETIVANDVVEPDEEPDGE